MINLYFNVERGALVRSGLESFQRSVPLISRLRIYRTLQRLSTRMRTKAPPPVPGYTRRGIYQKGWPLYPTRVGTSGYSITNPVEHAIYVVGDLDGHGQAYQNLAAGWVPFQFAAAEELRDLPTRIENVISVQAAIYGIR